MFLDASFHVFRVHMSSSLKGVYLCGFIDYNVWCTYLKCNVGGRESRYRIRVQNKKERERKLSVNDLDDKRSGIRFVILYSHMFLFF